MGEVPEGLPAHGLVVHSALHTLSRGPHSIDQVDSNPKGANDWLALNSAAQVQ